MQKRKFRFNILDLLIVAVIALCVAGALSRGGAKTTDEKLQTHTAILTYQIMNIQSESQYCFREGDRAYCPAFGRDLGKLTGKITATPAVFYNEDDGSIYKAFSSAGRVDIRGQIECEITESNGGFLLGGAQYIAPGMSLYLQLPNINVSVLVMDITLKS